MSSSAGFAAARLLPIAWQCSARQADFPAEAGVEPHAIILEQTWRRSRLLLLVYVIATLVYVTYKPSRQTGEGKKFANAETGNEVLHH